MAYIYSTLTNSISICDYTSPKGGTPRRTRTVTIAGGANVATKNLITPQGVVTEVSDEDLAFLKQNKMFNRMVDRGFIKVESKKVDVEKVVADMTGRDESAPLVPEDFQDDGKGAKPEGETKRKGKKSE